MLVLTFIIVLPFTCHLKTIALAFGTFYNCTLATCLYFGNIEHLNTILIAFDKTT